MSNQRAIHLKARAVLRDLGYSDGDTHREYKDWHIELRAGLSYVSAWTSDGMVFLSLANIPVYYVPGAWEHYLDGLFQRGGVTGRADGRERVTRLRELLRSRPESSGDS